ncbi:hypothetical protein [Psychromonas aquimarina]|uniref:hypothetical protein n=1 Tax=Psychromonas aquimarina TaxID=444919 RepID=UPI0003FA0D79|nr:hypothetical protein [Psychromonas aquimarina]
MFKFANNFNCCKAVHCRNFGVLNSQDYIHKSTRLGYLSTACKSCGSNPPWVNNELVANIIKEKLEIHFSAKLNHCPKCSSYFFFEKDTRLHKYGFTSSGRQRQQCAACGSVFTKANFKKNKQLQAVLSTIVNKQETREAIKTTGLSPKSYYFYLHQLSLILANFSRINEEKIIERKYLGLHSEGKVLSLKHKRGVYSLISSEINSGYILLQSHNLTRTKLHTEDNYQAHSSTIVVSHDLESTENMLVDRYTQNMKRKHFEQLLVGELKALTKCSLIYPDKLAYVHFQLLNAFTRKSQKYDHFIEHESTLRAGALMASLKEIKKANANVYFFVPLAKAGEHINGKKIGWWNDRWYSNEFAAYCPVTSAGKKDTAVPLKETNDVERFYSYLDRNINKGINSFNVINEVFEIQRVLFNYGELTEQQSRANRIGITDKIYTPESLLDEALHSINA